MDFGLGYIGVGIGAGLAILGAGLGIGRIGGSAVEGMSRQPDAAGPIQTGMIIAAALIEGAALFALVIMFQAGSLLNTELPKSVAKTPAAQTEQK
ncbi:ATP synthase F0 subunit C [Leptospira sp. GIMC2001]|uniref:ATP synthase F0 subunit C n=1 Tax=Leptospira sp. GIMC2001 TaxID=1513297 RepID=UPI00234B2792|nr:ATP synthase F0 subunit C [Leptospira sp. GIMC2001]WCL48929.1 ATP synthase F0 subunit C [Leptospira sp. GIMC2001]